MTDTITIERLDADYEIIDGAFDSQADPEASAALGRLRALARSALSTSPHPEVAGAAGASADPSSAGFVAANEGGDDVTDDDGYGEPKDPRRSKVEGCATATPSAALSASSAPAPQSDGWQPMETAASRDVLAERKRQIEGEGWSPEHDDRHQRGELAEAAANYAVGAMLACRLRASRYDASPPFAEFGGVGWPWSLSWWKPGHRRQMLVKAGALILAEIERLDRASPPSTHPHGPAPEGEEKPFVIDAAHLAHQQRWSFKTFGPGDRTAGVCDHIRKELAEIEAGDSAENEWIDVIILAFDGAWRAGHFPQAILDGIRDKQAKNEARDWPDWRTIPADKAIEHVRPVSPPPVEIAGTVEEAS